MDEDLLKILKLLTESEVDFVLIGGIAARFHGSSMLTQDVDVAIAMNEQNLLKASKALEAFSPRFRHKEPPIFFDEEQAKKSDWKNLYLETDLGVLDCLGEVKGVGDYDACVKGSVEVEIEDFTMRVLDRETLIQAKEAVGRPKDLQTVAQLKTLGGIER